MSSTTTTGTTRGGERERASPKPSTTQQKVDEVLRRKAEADRRVSERREALKQEQMNKLEKINAFREQERRERSRKNAEKELIRQKEALDRRQVQLEENQKKKEAILAKAHAATSRTANKDNTKKSFAFGSSTPRELAYLQTLSKEAKVYDKRLRPEPLSPTRLRPSAAIGGGGGGGGGSAVQTPNAMTTSVYVFSAPREVRPSPRVVNRIRSTVTASAPSNHPGGMTQSMHVSSTSSAFPHSQSRPPVPSRAARAAINGATPIRAPRPPTTTATTGKKREPAGRRAAAASSSQSPAGRAIRPRAVAATAVGTVGGGRGQPTAPSPLTVATNQEAHSSTSSLQQVENTPAAPPSEDSDAGFSEGSYERAGSEKSTPVHGGGVEQTIEEELTPREEQPPMAMDAAAEPVVVESTVEEEEVKEDTVAASLIDLTPPIALPSVIIETSSSEGAAVDDVIELDYSSMTTPDVIDTVQTPVVEAQLVVEEKEQEEVPEQPTVLQEEVHEDQATVPQEEVHEELATVPQELIQDHVTVPQQEIHKELATVPQSILEELRTVSQELTQQQLPTVPQEEEVSALQETAAVHQVIPEETPATTPEVTVAVTEERNLLVDFSEMTVQEKTEEEEDATPLVEEVTPIGERERSLADELGEIMMGKEEEKIEAKKEEEESLIQIDTVTDAVVAPSPIPAPLLIEDTVVNSLADELKQALGGVVVEKKEELPAPSATSPTPSHDEQGGLSSAHPSTSSLPSGSSSGTESGESSPNTRRKRTEEKKAEMVKQSAILAMADSAAKERDERKARLAAIMNRTRAGAATGGGPSTPTTPSMTTSMSASMIGSTSGETPSAASSVLAKIAHITSNPRIMQVAEKTGSSSDLRMGELPGAVPQY